eukprot:gene21135-24499_t
MFSVYVGAAHAPQTLLTEVEVPRDGTVEDVQRAAAALGEVRFPCMGCHGRLKVMGPDGALLLPSATLSDA